MGIKQRLSGILLLTVVFITGFSVFICTLTWLRFFMLLFGINITSAAVVITAFMFHLASGSRIFGILSDRAKKQANLLLLMFTVISAYSLVFGIAGSLAEKLNAWYTVNHNPDLFGVFVFRFLTAFVFLIPASFTGGIYPVFSRMFIRHVSQTGQKTGTVIFLMCAGAVAGFCLLSFYSAEEYGFRTNTILAASLLLLNGILLKLIRHEAIFSWSSLKKPLSQRVKKSGILLKKKKVLETESKLTRTLAWVFAFQGFWCMIFLLVWVKSVLALPETDYISLAKGIMLAGFPAFGAGALIFRNLSSNTSKKFFFLGIIYMVTGIVTVISYASFHIYPELFCGIEEVIPVHGSDIINDILPSAVMFFWPLLLLGATFPLASRLYPKRLGETGYSIGHLCFIFIWGAIAGLVITDFILIPVLGIYSVLFSAAVTGILAGLILFLRDSRFRRGFRIFLLIVIVIVMIIIHNKFTASDYRKLQTGFFTADSVLSVKQGITSTAVLVQNQDHNPAVYVDGEMLMESDNTTLESGRRLALIPSVMPGSKQSVYLSGFGTGVTASFLERYHFKNITVTETHPEIISFSSYAFSSFNNDILTRDVITITPEDSRSLLNRTNNDFDLILLDNGGPMARPDLFNTDFYSMVSSSLTERGIMCQTIPTAGLSAENFLSILKSCSNIFPNVSLWFTGGKGMMMAASPDSLWDFCSMNDNFNRLKSISAAGYESFESFMGSMLMGDDEVRSVSAEYPAFSDDKPMWLFEGRAANQSSGKPEDLISVPQVNYRKMISFSPECRVSETYVFRNFEYFRKQTLDEISRNMH